MNLTTKNLTPTPTPSLGFKVTTPCNSNYIATQPSSTSLYQSTCTSYVSNLTPTRLRHNHIHTQRKITQQHRHTVKRLETVDDYIVLLCEADVDEKLFDVVPLVTGQLNNRPVLIIVDNRSVAIELLLERLRKFPLVVLLFETLQRRDRLTAVTLLDTDVHFVLKHLTAERIFGTVGI